VIDERLARDLQIDPDTKRFTVSERSHPADLLDYAEHCAKGSHNVLMDLLRTSTKERRIPEFDTEKGRMHEFLLDHANSMARVASAFAEIARTRELINRQAVITDEERAEEYRKGHFAGQRSARLFEESECPNRDHPEPGRCVLCGHSGGQRAD
jgi:hypothetical protein